MTTIYTIGHSRHTAEHFVELLRAHAIEQLVDIRSKPASRWSPHFGKAKLEQLLAQNGIAYVFLGRELGGRLDEGVDYAQRAQATDFQDGIARLVEVARDRRTVILCAEENPARCHRRLLVTPALLRDGITVIHVRGDARLEPEALPLFSGQPA